MKQWQNLKQFAAWYVDISDIRLVSIACACSVGLTISGILNGDPANFILGLILGLIDGLTLFFKLK